MFRLFDIIILILSTFTFLISILMWFKQLYTVSVFIGIWALFILGMGIYFKLLRIVHFVLYKNVDNEDRA